mmetsp:Transcript_15057/g.22656  ORF Transcript_15057/g.22656 Transcript_15057/m.22656 type:complete len:187 (+) Transcript_15057:226-786(+)|eukprot:CAMPEP_0185025310 /NCGR_PEP_ID=MMETSP1103-20130426/8320_1 /TAXON_ID=36769 /ORGANISM="Paraphysomonas bandaiensis, Strain Caron Lab Isolate" /LENGTH=186 /DNA_ID=CAMNT_0027558487 /DNA_START=202 /DNA_END=762 /DNA_ORIENTATION=+
MSSYINECQSIINGIKAQGINFIGIDFDDTLVSTHTGGRWGGTPEGLQEYIRPFFHTFVKIATEQDVKIAIVTFSSQVELIREVMGNVFGNIVDKIPIRGRDNSWSYEGKGCKDGKQPHMASAAEFLKTRNSIDITRKTSLLIDDDVNNVRIALDNGVRAVRFDPDDEARSIRDLFLLFNTPTVSN